jgi:Tfp pilus assembly protein PilE
VTAFFMPRSSVSNKQAGFNPLQGVILIFIVLVLALVVSMAYFSSKRTARDAKRASDIQQLQLALKYFYEEFGYYPQASANNQAVGVDNAGLSVRGRRRLNRMVAVQINTMLTPTNN